MKNKAQIKRKITFRRAYGLIRKLRGYERIIDVTNDMWNLRVLHGEIILLKGLIQATISDEMIRNCHLMYSDSMRDDSRYFDYAWITNQLVKIHGRNQTAWQKAKQFRDKLRTASQRPL